jgi:hypothetical protein
MDSQVNRDFLALNLSERVEEIHNQSEAMVERFKSGDFPWPKTPAGRDLDYATRTLRLAFLQLKQAERFAREALNE